MRYCHCADCCPCVRRPVSLLAAEAELQQQPEVQSKEVVGDVTEVQRRNEKHCLRAFKEEEWEKCL